MSLDSKSSSKFFSTFKSILYALVIALFIRYIFVQPFKIPSKSMYPTLLVGDQILVDRFNYGLGFPCSSSKIVAPFKIIKRGDVVVFRFPEDKDSKNCPNGGFVGLSSIYYIKRIVGIPGDVVTIKESNLYINGKEISSKTSRIYNLDGVNHTIYENNFTSGTKEVIYRTNGSIPNDIQNLTIPYGNYFVLGDNRDNSLDSRFWGFVPRENIVGKAFIIHFSWNNNFKNVKDILRTRRFFKVIE
tara:strand:+ start:3849 stop:4580 length:732 start_codon:yes stop_codon:yes gene_type:complete